MNDNLGNVQANPRRIEEVDDEERIYNRIRNFIPEFKGFGSANVKSDLDRFINAARWTFDRTQNNDEGVFLQLLIFRLTGDAFDRVANQEIATVAELLELLVDIYSETQSLEDLFSKCFECRQKINETAKQFGLRLKDSLGRYKAALNAKFNEAPNRLHLDTLETMAIKTYKQGISDQAIRKQLLIEEFRDCNAVINRAKVIENVYASESKRNSNIPLPSPQIDQLIHIVCSFCGKKGHVWETCLSRKNRPPCAMCDTFGHSADTCQKITESRHPPVQNYQRNQNNIEYSLNRSREYNDNNKKVQSRYIHKKRAVTKKSRNFFSRPQDPQSINNYIYERDEKFSQNFSPWPQVPNDIKNDKISRPREPYVNSKFNSRSREPIANNKSIIGAQDVKSLQNFSLRPQEPQVNNNYISRPREPIANKESIIGARDDKSSHNFSLRPQEPQYDINNFISRPREPIANNDSIIGAQDVKSLHNNFSRPQELIINKNNIINAQDEKSLQNSPRYSNNNIILQDNYLHNSPLGPYEPKFNNKNICDYDTKIRSGANPIKSTSLIPQRIGETKLVGSNLNKLLLPVNTKVNCIRDTDQVPSFPQIYNQSITNMQSETTTQNVNSYTSAVASSSQIKKQKQGGLKASKHINHTKNEMRQANISNDDHKSKDYILIEDIKDIGSCVSENRVYTYEPIYENVSAQDVDFPLQSFSKVRAVIPNESDIFGAREVMSSPQIFNEHVVVSSNTDLQHIKEVITGNVTQLGKCDKNARNKKSHPPHLLDIPTKEICFSPISMKTNHLGLTNVDNVDAENWPPDGKFYTEAIIHHERNTNSSIPVCNFEDRVRLKGIGEGDIISLGSGFLNFKIGENEQISQNFQIVDDNFPIKEDGIIGRNFFISSVDILNLTKGNDIHDPPQTGPPKLKSNIIYTPQFYVKVYA